MDQFIRTQNVARYRRLLERVTEESDQTNNFQSTCRRATKAKRRGRSNLNSNGVAERVGGEWRFSRCSARPRLLPAFHTSKEFGDIELDQGRQGRKS